MNFRPVPMILAALALAGCSSESSYRFRMTVEVESPRGLISGNSVYQVSARKTLRLTSEESSGGGGLRGQALAVDLPDGPIFVLLKMRAGRGNLESAATEALSGNERKASFDDYLATVRRLGGWFSSAEAELPREDWPIMVRFRDVNDPATVEQVDPVRAGVKRIVLETTSDDVTKGIEKRLPWLPSQAGSLIRRLSAPDPAKPPFGATIHAMDFSTELSR